MTFGKVIGDARKKMSLSQKDLASKIVKEDGEPISPQYLNDIEHDRRNPPATNILAQFAKTLSLDLDYLCYLSNQFPADIARNYDPKDVKEAFVAFRKTLRAGSKSS